MNAARLLKRARLAIYAILLVLVGYFFLRYDVVGLAKEGSSPLLEFEPGARLLIDRWPGAIREGDVVLYEGLEERIQLGRVRRPPATAPAETWAACEAGSLWIEGDRPGHPLRDSRVLGPVAPDRIAGRVKFGLPW